MTQADKLSLNEQRRLLRGELFAQRQQIVRQLDPAIETNAVYPRSMTMRFLSEHSTLAGSVFSGAATLLVGARYFKRIATAFTVFQAVRAATHRKGN